MKNLSRSKKISLHMPTRSNGALSHLELNPRDLTAKTIDIPKTARESFQSEDSFKKQSNKEIENACSLASLLKNFSDSNQIKSELIVRNQEKIIKMQASCIKNLKNELKLLAKKNRGKEDEDNFISSLKSETTELEKKIKVLKSSYKKDLKIMKLCLTEKDKEITELKKECKARLKKKNGDIEKLLDQTKKIKEENQKISSKASELAKVRSEYFKELQEKNKVLEDNRYLNDRVRVLSNENKRLTQNYKDLQDEHCATKEECKSVKNFIEKNADLKYELSSLISQFEIISKKNEIMNEKLKVMSDRNLLIDSENNDLKLALFKARKNIDFLSSKVKCFEELETVKNSAEYVRRHKSSMDFKNFADVQFLSDTCEFNEKGGLPAVAQKSDVENELCVQTAPNAHTSPHSKVQKSSHIKKALKKSHKSSL